MNNVKKITLAVVAAMVTRGLLRPPIDPSADTVISKGCTGSDGTSKKQYEIEISRDHVWAISNLMLECSRISHQAIDDLIVKGGSLDTEKVVTCGCFKIEGKRPRVSGGLSNLARTSEC